MADLNQILGDIFWGVRNNTMRQARQRSMDESRLSEFFRQPERFQGMEDQRMIPPEVKESYQGVYGMPWPRVETDIAQPTEDTPIGFLAENFEMSAQPRTVEDMLLRQAGQQGRAQGTIAGEKAVTQGGYQPQIIEQQGTAYDLYNEMLKNFGEDPGKYGVMEGVTGLQRYQEEPAEETDEWGPIQKHPSGYTYQTEQRTGEVKKIDRPPEGTSTGDPEQEQLIKGAQQFVLKFAGQSQNQMVQMMFAMNPEMATKNPAMQAMLRDEVPEQFKPVFDQAISILNQHYTTGATEMGAEPVQDPLGILK